jgi:hypothetical protein
VAVSFIGGENRATGRWFSPGTTVFSTNKTNRHDITELLLKVALNTINQTKPNQTKSSLNTFISVLITSLASSNFS